MPICLLCPSGDQPSFVEIGELTNHISQAHPNMPRSPSPGCPPRQLPTTTQCCVCNKKFASLLALSSHQSAKQHYPPRSGSPRKLTGSEELPRQLTPLARVSSPSPVINGSTPASKSEQRIHRCVECQANFDSFAQLEAHRSTHKKIPCSKCSYLSSSLLEWNDHFKLAHKNQPSSLPAEVIVAPPRSPSPAIVRPASAQSMSNKNVAPNPQSKALVICDVCKKPFKGQAGLQAHKAAKHPVGAECGICHLICPSTTSLEEHVDTTHSCGVCHDGILRDAQTLSDHKMEHSHPILCKRCGTRYQTEEERKLHFTAADNDHPVCIICCIGFEDDDEFRTHTNLAHLASPQPSPRPSSRRFSAEFGVDAYAATESTCVFQCDVCHEACSSQTELDVHVVTVHSCPICHDGTYMDTRTLEEHLEQHRSRYACHSCGLAYTEEDQLLEHYKQSPDNIHPHCKICQLGFGDDDMYTTHVDEVHPRIACDVCDGELFDQRELAAHYLSSRKHPKCEKCDIGFRDRFDYTDHGASMHPECHCYLCQWHFDTPNILQNHIRHFFNHPKCQDCNIRFADADAYQYHLFAVHRPRFSDQGRLTVSTVKPDRETKMPQGDLSSPLLSARAFDPVWGFEGSASLPYASYVPLPPSLSDYSSPTSQRVIAAESASISGSHSRSSTLSVEQRSPTDGQWNAANQSHTLNAGKNLKASPEFNHSPLSTLPAVGTPLISSVQTIQSADFQSPFSPRPEPTPLCSLTQSISVAAVTVGKHEEVDSDSSSSFAHSPPLISPVVKLPDPGAVSPSSTSSWTMTSDTGSRRSMPHPNSHSPPSKGINGTFSSGPTTTTEYSVSAVPQLSLLVPSSTQIPGSASNSGYPSSISPESAGIPVSANMTPEYLREARAYLSLTHHAPDIPSPASPTSPRSPGISSPVLSSTGLALGDRGRRREVRFEDNIISEPVWDRESTSSDSSLDPPVALSRPGTRMNGISKLPRFSALRRPTRRWANGQTHHHGPNRRSNGGAPPPSYHCRACYKDHCEEPTTTTCGHLFCYECISTAVMKDARCPVCEAPTLLYCLFRIDTSA